MPHITIDNQHVEVPAGTTILEAAGKVGIEIPHLCHRQGMRPCTSCFVCVVRLQGKEGFSPSCATVVTEGMVVESEHPEVRTARKAALELLLSEHVGDCLGPCQLTCPAGMEIPLMTRQIAQGDLAGAIATIKRDIPLPAVLGRICPAPCEKGCRRNQHDGGLAICLLKRFAADADLATPAPYRPEIPPPSGKRVAIIGAGPAGLSAAYYLAAAGHAVTVYDDHEHPGGTLRYAIKPELLPPGVVDAEVAQVAALGVRFITGQRVGRDVPTKQVRAQADAVLLACGMMDESLAKLAGDLGAACAKTGIRVDARTFQTAAAGVFACGNAIRKPVKLAVRSVGEGKSAAIAIDQYLRGRAVTGREKPFSVHMGKLSEAEMEQFLAAADAPEAAVRAGRNAPNGSDGSLSDATARAEAQRCLHCDCRKFDGCLLRIHAQQYAARPNAYHAQRRLFQQDVAHAEMIYERGKCIACGLCVQIAEKANQAGLTFFGRGYDVQVKAPLDATLATALDNPTAAACADACPTGAMVAKIVGRAT